MNRTELKKHWIGIISLPFLLVLSLSDVPDASADGGGVYSVYDANRDGYLDRVEYEEFLATKRIRQNTADIWQFDNVDADGDDKISEQEMVNALMEEVKRKKQDR